MTLPCAISKGSPRAASASAAAARCPSLNASRAASAAARRSAFEGVVGVSGMRLLVPSSSSAKAGDPVFQSTRDRTAKPRRTGYPTFAEHDEKGWTDFRQNSAGDNTNQIQHKSNKVRGRDAVGTLDPGVPYESRWAPYVRIHGPGQGQFPKGSIRPRGYMAPDARHSFAGPM